MAYQLPPPIYHDDPNVRAWLFEMWRRDLDLLDTEATIALTGDVTAPATSVDLGAWSVPTAINLPNITRIDGGKSDSTYPVATAGPYGTNPLEGTEILSTGETGGTKFLREDGDGTCSWQAAAGGGSGTWDEDGNSNLVAGALAGAALTTAADSIFIGSNAGNKVTSADRNVFIGYLAGNTASTSFGRNVAVGANALENTSTGYYNVCLGQDAGQNLSTTSAYNVCIGPGAGPSSSTAENTKLYIHDGPGTPLIGGDFGAGEVTMSAETGNFDLYLNTVQSAKLQSIIFQDGGSNRGRVYHSHNAGIMYFHVLASNTTSVAAQIQLRLTGGGMNLQTGGSSGVTAQDNIVLTGLGTSTGVATFSSRIVTQAATTSRAYLNLPHGAAPTSPVDGDIWVTSSGLYVRVNGVTVGPLS